MKTKTSVIILAGGMGTRMLSSIPKQFMTLGDKPIACHSFQLFLSLAEIDEIIVVCDPKFKEVFNIGSSKKTVLFALPGERRQDSVYQGLQISSGNLICIHDAARPFITKDLVLKVLEIGHKHGAAALGMPLKFTIKEINAQNVVKNTPDRNNLWEIQTPQVLHRDLLIQGFDHVHKYHLTVTDDVSLVELIGKEVKLVEGSYNNVKITIPADIVMGSHLLSSL